MREESHLDDMRAAIRGDFERLAERRGGQELMSAPPEPERAPAAPAEPRGAVVEAPEADGEAAAEPELQPELEAESEPTQKPEPTPDASISEPSGHVEPEQPVAESQPPASERDAGDGRADERDTAEAGQPRRSWLARLLGR